MLILIAAHLTRVERYHTEQFFLRDQRYRGHGLIRILEICIRESEIESGLRERLRCAFLQYEAGQPNTNLHSFSAESCLIQSVDVGRFCRFTRLFQKIDRRGIEGDELPNLLRKEREYLIEIELS